MMIGNASKVIKRVVGGIDFAIITKALERLYYYNMRYLDDPDLKGDVRIVARGAMSLATKEAAQVRRNEFLAATANEFDMQIVGLPQHIQHAAGRGIHFGSDAVARKAYDPEAPRVFDVFFTHPAIVSAPSGDVNRRTGYHGRVVVDT